MTTQTPEASATERADGENAASVGQVRPQESLEPAPSPLLLEQDAADLDLDGLVDRYRELASRLLFDCGGDEHVCLAVTSAVPGEGVTTSCAVTALALARSTTKNVLLLDANLRRPALHALLGTPAEPGLFQMVRSRRSISGQASARDKVSLHRTSLPNLWVTPAGVSLDDPTQLLTSNLARDAVEALIGRFGYVVVDCPPVLTSVDASALCRLATRTVIVVRAELTPREEVARACARLAGANLMGVLLNGVAE